MIIYIGDDMVNLYKTAQVFFTVQRVNLYDLKVRNVSFSNNFQAPWTENNARLFGFAREEESGSEKIHSLRQCRIVDEVDISQSLVLYITK